MISNLRFVIGILAIYLLPTFAQAQYQTINVDYERTYFNEGQKLPSESLLLFTGEIQRNIDLVEITIFPANKLETASSIYGVSWYRPINQQTEKYSVPVNYRLKGNNQYDISIAHFTKLSRNESQKLSDNITQGLDAYIDQVVLVESKRIKLSYRPSKIREQLDEIAKQGSYYMRSDAGRSFPGFSDIILESLKRIDGLRHDRLQSDSSPEELIDALKKQVASELSQLFTGDMLILTEQRNFVNYPTDSQPNTLSINVGYAGVIRNFSNNTVDYATAPYAGLSFPLAGQLSESAFLRNSALSVGVFLTNLTFSEGVERTGPLVGRPTYVGYGYSFLRYFRAQAGVAFLESTDADSSLGNFSQVSIQPFIGLSFEFKLWAGLN